MIIVFSNKVQLITVVYCCLMKMPNEPGPPVWGLILLLHFRVYAVQTLKSEMQSPLTAVRILPVVARGQCPADGNRGGGGL